MTPSLQTPEKNENARQGERKNLREDAGRSSEEYRKSGLALSATLIALSSGGFIGLWRQEATNSLVLLYVLPIALAVLQQLSHYLGSQRRAKSDLQKLYQSPAPDEQSYLEAYIREQVDYRYSEFYFAMSDRLVCLATFTLGIATLWVLFSLAIVGIASLVLGAVIVALALGMWAWSWWRLSRELARTVW